MHAYAAQDLTIFADDNTACRSMAIRTQRECFATQQRRRRAFSENSRYLSSYYIEVSGDNTCMVTNISVLKNRDMKFFEQKINR